MQCHDTKTMSHYEFTQIYQKGYMITLNDVDTIMKCKNIDFGHVTWPSSFFNDTDVICHIVDNIVDVNVVEHTSKICYSYTLLQNIYNYVRDNQSIIYNWDMIGIYYLLNNGHVNEDTFVFMDNYGYIYETNNPLTKILNQYKCFVEYLVNLSMNKFTRFYNVEKYYDTCVIVLLVIKRYQKLGTNKWLPTSIIKHLILPFIYQ